VAKKNRIPATFKKPDYQKRWDAMIRKARPWLLAYDDFYEKKVNKLNLH